MKKWFAVLSVFFCCMLWVLPVRADVIWEPRDSFYESHTAECKYVGRTYTANGPKGEVILYESPVSAKKVATWENGHTAYVSFSYEDEKGTLWGVCEEGDESGWVPMDYMDIVYDNISFAQEYAAEIRKESGTLDERYMDQDVYFWRYPASPASFTMKMTHHMPEYHRIYTDSQGHTWGNVGYYYGHKDFWVCLDAPDAELGALYPEDAPEIGTSQPEEKVFTEEPITPEGGKDKTMKVAVIVLLTVILTAVFLFAQKKWGIGKGDPWDDDFYVPPFIG